MINIAVSMSPDPGPGMTLMKQCGIEHAVDGISLEPIPDTAPEEQQWSHASLVRAKAAYEDSGITLSVIESRPPSLRRRLSRGLREAVYSE